jgi:hypothetical protein
MYRVALRTGRPLDVGLGRGNCDVARPIKRRDYGENERDADRDQTDSVLDSIEAEDDFAWRH